MIHVQEVTKYYGKKRTLGPISFQISKGEAVGLLGLNGAGKTTALRIFAGDLMPSSGKITIGGVDAIKNPHAIKQDIGYVPENPPLYPDMLVEEYLKYAGKLRGMSASDILKRLPMVLEATDLRKVRGQVISTLSHGYRQRVGVGQAMIHDPALLIMDEPTRGLDPVQVVEMRNLIQRLKENHTILISSHMLTEISETCDRFLILGDGQIMAEGSESELSEIIESECRVLLCVRAKEGSGDGDVIGLLEAMESVLSVTCKGQKEKGWVFEICSSKDVRSEAVRVLVAGGHDLLALNKDQQELENIFLKLVKGGNAGV